MTSSSIATRSSVPTQHRGARMVLVLLVGSLVLASAAGCYYVHDDDPVIRFENYTSDLVDVYIDGRYKATLGPFGSASFDVRRGYHELYAEDEFGGDWGPITVFVGYDDRFIYELRP